MHSNRYIQELQTRFKDDISWKETYTWLLSYYDGVIGDILATPPIDHVRLEYYQHRSQNCSTRLQELKDSEIRIVVALLQLRR